MQRRVGVAEATGAYREANKGSANRRAALLPLVGSTLTAQTPLKSKAGHLCHRHKGIRNRVSPRKPLHQSSQLPAPSSQQCTPTSFRPFGPAHGITQLPGTYLCSGCVQWCPDRTATPLKSSSVDTSVAWRPSTLNEHRDARPRGAEGGGPYTVTRGTLLSRSYKYLRSRQRGQPRQSISQACSTKSQLSNQTTAAAARAGCGLHGS